MYKLATSAFISIFNTGTTGVISSDNIFEEWRLQFTTVPLQLLTDEGFGSYHS